MDTQLGNPFRGPTPPNAIQLPSSSLPLDFYLWHVLALYAILLKPDPKPVARNESSSAGLNDCWTGVWLLQCFSL